MVAVRRPSLGIKGRLADNGNVASIANNRNTNRSQSFTYDELNRIKTAQSAATSGNDCWGLQFGYDIWANLLSAAVTKCSPPALNVGVSTKNQINNANFQYDAAGNLTFDGSLSVTYDAENRIISTNAGVTYTYDGDGRRVKKSNGKLYWHGTGSDPLEETDLSGTATADYIFFGGKRTARLDLPGAVVHYYFANHLGSTSIVTSATGTIQEESDYYPFGGERVVIDTDPNQYKFTGKERDTESGLDFFIARYYSSGYGRFLSPDEFTGGPVDAFSSGDPLPPGPLPYADVTDPQSLNKYTYSLNQPLRYTDPEGHSVAIFDPTLCLVGNCADGELMAGGGGKKKKDGPPDLTAQDLNRGVGKALLNEGIGLDNAANAVARLAGEKNVPDDKALLQPDTPGEKLVMNLVSALLIASAMGGGKGKIAREAGEGALERHHWLVRQFKEWFEGPGRKISIERFTELIQKGLHRGKGNSLHGSEFNINRMWQAFIKKFPNATREQTMRKLRQIKAKWSEFSGGGQ